MNKESYGKKIKLNSFDDLFGINDPIKGAAAEIKEIPLVELHAFDGHPFRVEDDEKMDELVASVKKNGVLVPGICRIRSKGGYEIISGHRRKRACELAGLEKIPMFVKNLSDSDATVAMVDANLQREQILPSEKAKAYQMRYNAMKRQGANGDSLDRLIETTGESRKQIQRYLQLARLSDELLSMVDSKKINFTAGVNLSFLRVNEQRWVSDILTGDRIRVSIRQSEILKNYSQERKLDAEKVEELLLKKEETKKQNRLQFDMNSLRDYFDESYDEDAMKTIILKLLSDWKDQQMGGGVGGGNADS